MPPQIASGEHNASEGSQRSRSGVRGSGRGGRKVRVNGVANAIETRGGRRGARATPNFNAEQARNCKKSHSDPLRNKQVRFAPDGKGGSSANIFEAWRDPTKEGNTAYQHRMNDLYQQLKKDRERERRDAIAKGMLADPTKAMSLADAITPVGTCQDMCAEFERVERIVQNEVKGPEKSFAGASERLVPCEELMVKKFRRSAAGHDEQLPSDIRPPHVLKRTLDYLFNDVVGNCERLGDVHHFVWDRTRAVRNDFSIQQLTKAPDVRIAIECYERIARFHILSLHQLSIPGNAYPEYTNHQEQEQLDKTLLSLMYYYDDSRNILKSPNEAEFRAYCIIFQIRERCPDTEERAQRWSKEIFWDPRVQRALSLYAAATSIVEEQGPLHPYTGYSIAQGHYGRFWSVVGSPEISYLMACVAEIYFNHVRKAALSAIIRAYKQGGQARTEDWTLNDLTTILGLNDEDEVRIFCEAYGLRISERADGEEYLEIRGIGRDLLDPNPPLKQFFSHNLVEKKRHGRTLSSLINGMTAAVAKEAGMIEEAASDDNAALPQSKEDSLFIAGDSEDDEPSEASAQIYPDSRVHLSGTPPALNPFAPPFKPLPGPGIPQSMARDIPSGAFSLTPSDNSFSAAPSTNPSSNPFRTTTVPFKFPQVSSSLSPFASPNLIGNHKPEPLSFNPFQLKGDSETVLNKPTSTSLNPFAAGFVTSESQKAAQSSIFGKQSFPENGTVQHSPASADVPKEKGEPTTNTLTVSNLKSPMKSPETHLFTPESNTAIKSTTSFLRPSTQQAEFNASTSSHMQDLGNTSVLEAQPSPPFGALKPPSPGLTPEAIEKSSSAGASSTPSPQSTIFQPKTEANDVGPVISATRNIPLQAPQSTLNMQVTGTDRQYPTAAADEMGTPAIEKCLSRPIVSTMAGHRQSIPSKNALHAHRKMIMDKTLNQITSSLFLEPYGLLEQLVEHTIGPIILQAQRHLEEEMIFNKADELRQSLLARRFTKRWRAICWKLRLFRQGRERRQRFADDAKRIARESRHRSETAEFAETLFRKDQSTQGLSIPLPHSTEDFLPQHLNGLPERALTKQNGSAERCSSIHNQGQLRSKTTATSLVSNNLSSYSQATSRLRSRGRRSATSSDRSSAVSVSRSFTGVRNGNTASRARLSIDSSFLSDDSLLSSSVIAQARKFVPERRLSKQDTTQAPYFRMKALGLDPNASLPTPPPHSRLPSTLSFSQYSSSNMLPRARDTDESFVYKPKPAILSTSISPSSPCFLGTSQNASSIKSKKRSRGDRERENGAAYETVGMDEAITSANAAFRPKRAFKLALDDDISPAQSNTSLAARKMAKVESSARNPTVKPPLASRADDVQETSLDDEDEGLFAQMRCVREAMGESIRFFQEESARSEHSGFGGPDEESNTNVSNHTPAAPSTQFSSTAPLATPFRSASEDIFPYISPLISAHGPNGNGNILSQYHISKRGIGVIEADEDEALQSAPELDKDQRSTQNPFGYATESTPEQQQQLEQQQQSGLSMEDAIQL